MNCNSSNASSIDENTHYYVIIKFAESDFPFYIRKSQTLEYLILKIFSEFHYKTLNEFLKDFKLIYNNRNILAEHDETKNLKDIFFIEDNNHKERIDESNIVLLLEKKHFDSNNKKRYILDNLKTSINKIKEITNKINKETIENLIQINIELPISEILEQVAKIKNDFYSKLLNHHQSVNFMENLYEELSVNNSLNYDIYLDEIKGIKYIDFNSLINCIKNLKKEIDKIQKKLASNYYFKFIGLIFLILKLFARLNVSFLKYLN